MSELKQSSIKKAKTIIETYKQIDTKDKKMIIATITEFFRIFKENIKEQHKHKNLLK